MAQTLLSLLAVLTPMVGVPLTVITFYLRSLRDQQEAWHAELDRRLETVEDNNREMRQTLRAYERDYTTKEEWLRECMLARKTLMELKESTVRLEANWLSPSRGTPMGTEPDSRGQEPKITNRGNRTVRATKDESEVIEPWPTDETRSK